LNRHIQYRYTQIFIKLLYTCCIRYTRFGTRSPGVYELYDPHISRKYDTVKIHKRLIVSFSKMTFLSPRYVWIHIKYKNVSSENIFRFYRRIIWSFLSYNIKYSSFLGISSTFANITVNAVELFLYNCRL